MFLSVVTHHVIFKVFGKHLYVVVLVKRAVNMINIKRLDPLLYFLGIVSDGFLIVLVLNSLTNMGAYVPNFLMSSVIGK